MARVGIFIFFAIFIIANGQGATAVNYYAQRNSSVIRNDEYIEAVRHQNNFHIWYFDLQINTFRETYLERVNDIEIQKQSLLDAIQQANENVFPLTVLSDLSGQCVRKYSPLIPSLVAAESEVERCMVNARIQVNSLTTYMVSTNRTLADYYKGNFENGVKNCATKFNNTYPENYTHCLADVVSASNAYTASKQKTFSEQLQTAKGSANSYVKIAHECSFAVQNSTISNIQRSTDLIGHCLNGWDENSKCINQTGYYCEQVHRMPSYLIDFSNLTMLNPFYGQKQSGDCLMLNIVNYV
ncbi:uncharacterized protein [Musca autumnalis]|uniref:uncharacterized protein n=1 Tax=Musca autumnalis TaxID=221902 RepID=UPI003CF9C871